jgi:hypothetical protein
MTDHKLAEADSFKYYVVRNKETGQYFRGKGVNKWGKYYNQASIYRFKTHAENAVEEESRRSNPSEVVEIRITEATSDIEKAIDQDLLLIELDNAKSTIAALKYSHKDTMRKMRAGFAAECVNYYNAGRTEAIKEFAQRLKSDLGRIPQHQFTRSQVEWSINTFVKEMTEENNESQST